MKTVLDIQVLYTKDCTNTQPAVQRIQDVAQSLGIAVRVRQVLVASQDLAQELRFLGSPTIQINGQDIDPTARAATAFGFT